MSESESLVEGGWRPIESAPEERLVLLYMALPGEPLGFDIGWLEDGDWMLSSKDNEPADVAQPTHWQPLPAPPA
jgi:hypothetical protein